MSDISSLHSTAVGFSRLSSQRYNLELQKNRQEQETQKAEQQAVEKTTALDSQNENSQLTPQTQADLPNAKNGDAELKAKKAKLERLEARLKQAELKEIRQLKSRDREVKQHELAHSAVGGQFSGAPSYSFVTGPDGMRYAVSGEVSVSLKTSSDPKQTIENMQQVQRAALAPAEPSIQDIKVAAEASRIAASARAQLLKEKREETQESSSSSSEPDAIDTSETQSSSKHSPQDTYAFFQNSWYNEYQSETSRIREKA